MAGSAEGYFFDHSAALKAERFFRQYCTHVDGGLQGSALRLLPWQASRIVRPLFGWKRESDKTRRYRVVYLEVPKKNAKSTLATGLALLMGLADGERSPYVYCVAGSRKQAGIIFDECRKMVSQNPLLASMCKPMRTSVVSEFNGGTIMVLSADASLAHGVKASAVFFDELHVQKNSRLVDSLKGAGIARDQPVHFYCTTAGEKKEGVAWEMHQYALKVLSGEKDDPSFLPVIYGADPEDPTWEESTWYRANPSLQRPGQAPGQYTLSFEDFRELAHRARNGSPRDVRSFRQLHLNIWGEPEAGFFNTRHWLACDDPVDPLALAGLRWWAGFDLSNTSDMTSLVLVSEPDSLGVSYVLGWHFLPERVIARRVRNANVAYDRWVNEGYIETCPGEAIDREMVYNRFRQIASRFKVVGMGIDPYKADELGTALESTGVSVVQIRQTPQGLSEATKELETHILRRRIAHGGDPVLGWAIGNAVAKPDDAGNVMLSKKRSPELIDPAQALVISLAARRLEEPAKASVYAHENLYVSGVATR